MLYDTKFHFHFGEFEFLDEFDFLNLYLYSNLIFILFYLIIILFKFLNYLYILLELTIKLINWLIELYIYLISHNDCLYRHTFFKFIFILLLPWYPDFFEFFTVQRHF